MSIHSSAALSADAQRLLTARLAGVAAADGPGAVDGSGGGSDAPVPPISSDQYRLWFIDQLRPGGLEYIVDGAFRLRGPLSADRFVEAVRAVVRRHDALRTRVPIVDGEPGLVVDDAATVGIAILDVSDRADPVAVARQVAVDAVNTPFDLARGPLFRPWLARLGPEDHAFGFTVHHVIFDRESLDVLLAEVTSAYERLTGADGPEPSPPAAQFADFARWQRGRASAPEREADRAYWRERIRDVPVMLELPTDRPRPSRPTARAGEVTVAIPPAAAAALHSVATAHRTTPFVPALAAFQGLLLRYSPGTRAVAVGCPFNARTRVEFEGLIGFFARSLPIVARLGPDGDATFDALVSSARDALLGAHEHQELPLDEIIQLAGPPRDLGHNPLFQVWFDLAADAPASDRWPRGIVATPLPTGLPRTRFDLELHLVDAGRDGLTGRLLYAVDLFDHATAEEFVRHYERFLAAAAASPQRRLSTIPLLADEEQKMIVNQWAVGGGGGA